MKALAIAIISVVLLSGCGNSTSPTSGNTGIALDTIEAQAAFTYLNTIRITPSAFSTECNFDLSNVQARPILTYNKILEKVAREKALDMATRGYFAHQNPENKGIDHLIVQYGYSLDSENYLINESTSNYESLESAGTSKGTPGISFLTGRTSIQNLIWDGGVPNGGHREHLLGIGMRSTLDEIGIGFVRCKNGELYKNYTCVIIAKKK